MAMYSVIHNRKLLLLSDYAPFPIPSLPPQPPTTAPPTLTPLALVFVSLIALILLLALLYGIFTMCSAFCKCHSNSHDLAEQDSQPSSNGLQSEGLDPKFIQDFISDLQSAPFVTLTSRTMKPSWPSRFVTTCFIPTALKHGYPRTWPARNVAPLVFFRDRVFDMMNRW